MTKRGRPKSKVKKETPPNSHDVSWGLLFNALVAFKKKHGHTNVPARYAEHKKLGHWVIRQRNHQKTLSEERKEKLNSIGFVWNYAEHSWNEKYEQLVKFYNKHGHTKIRFSDPKYSELASWINLQRATNKSKPALLTPYKRKKLNELNFNWFINESKWEKNFEKLKAFKKRFKHTVVPYRWKEDPSLAYWVSGQRQYKERLSPENLKKLNTIGFLWEVPFKDRLLYRLPQ